MTDASRIRELLEEILVSRCTPEEACAETPELLPQVRASLKRLSSVANQIDELFPSSSLAAADLAGRAAWGAAAELPRIDGYDMVGVLGHGAMGIVYQARHQKLKRTVALKMLRSGAYASPLELARFVREAEAVARLQHPQIVQIHDVGDLEGRPYFTMEFLAGGSLAEELAGTPQPARRAAEVVSVLADAVQLAHQNGIIHRDLKPANILLAADGTPKIADFGLARQVDEGPAVTLSGARIGTPSYMAPEQALGKARAIGPAVDIYALGAILYEMLTGRPPFRADSAVETERQVIDDEPVPPSRMNRNVPRDLETICLKCLHKDPQRRYTTSAALAADVRRFLEGRPIEARPLGSGERIWRWVQRKPASAALVATVLAMIGLALGGGLWLAHQRAAQQTDMARQEGRDTQAVRNALEKSETLQQQGRWSEAREVLDETQRLLGSANRDNLGERLRQARADADMAAELDEIRMRFSEGREADLPNRVSVDEAYLTAFQNYGIDLTRLTPAIAAQRIGDSAIRLTLLAYLHDWLFRAPEAIRGKVRAVVEEADDNGWRRAFREALAVGDTNRLRELSRAPGAAAQPSVVLSGLSSTLFTLKYRQEAIALLRTALMRYPGDFWINFLLGTVREGDSAQIGVGYFRAAVALRPGSDQAWSMLGRSLLDVGDATGATAAFRQSLALNPNGAAALELPPASTPADELEQARVIWGKVLERNPPQHDAWYGYAQLCLFLGHEDAYRNARGALLDHFGETANSWIVGERTSMACLLLPDSGDDLRRTVRLVELAVTDAEKSDSARDNPYLDFVQGFAEYRQGRYEPAIPLLQKSAARLPNRAGPRLVLAMAQFQAGFEIEGRKTFATAVRGYNWSESVVMTHAERATAWFSHILRREAERMMLPHLEASLQGEHQPQNNDERLAMLGICQFQALHGTAAGLYAAAFADDPGLANDLNADCIRRAQGAEAPGDPCETFNTACRFLAARSAALAGSGLGKDAEKLGDADRGAWRKQARDWLRADLAEWVKTIDGEPSFARDLARRLLPTWQTDPDLAGLRDPGALDKLPDDEQRDCRALWQEVRDAIKRSPPK